VNCLIDGKHSHSVDRLNFPKRLTFSKQLKN